MRTIHAWRDVFHALQIGSADFILAALSTIAAFALFAAMWIMGGRP